MNVKSDHRGKFSNLSNWKEEAWKNFIIEMVMVMNGNVWTTKISWGGLPHKEDGDSRRKFWLLRRTKILFLGMIWIFFQSQLKYLLSPI